MSTKPIPDERRGQQVIVREHEDDGRFQRIAMPGQKLTGGGAPAQVRTVGRPPSMVQAACRMAFEQRIPFLKDIIDGKVGRRTAHVTASGRVVKTIVYATITERIQCMKLLAQTGQLMTVRVELPEDPLTPAHFDLSKLSPQELSDLEHILEKTALVSLPSLPEHVLGGEVEE